MRNRSVRPPIGTLGEGIGHAEGVLEGAIHGPLAGAAGEHERAVDVEEHQACRNRHSDISSRTSVARGPFGVHSSLNTTRSPTRNVSSPPCRTPDATKNQSPS